MAAVVGEIKFCHFCKDAVEIHNQEKREQDDNLRWQYRRRNELQQNLAKPFGRLRIEKLWRVA